MLRGLWVALGFLTILPVRVVPPWREDDLARGLLWYPLVGLLLGGMWAAGWWLLAEQSALLRSALMLALSFALTGGLHVDGLCDMADAVLASASLAERQRIVKDVHVGSFALMVALLVALLKVAAWESLGQRYSLEQAMALLLLVPVSSRSALLWLVLCFPLHAASSLGRALLPVRGAPLAGRCWLSCGLSYALQALLLAGVLGWGAAWLLAAGFLATLSLATWFNRRMHGLGGDAYGALLELKEVFMLLALLWL